MHWNCWVESIWPKSSLYVQICNKIKHTLEMGLETIKECSIRALPFLTKSYVCVCTHIVSNSELQALRKAESNKYEITNKPNQSTFWQWQYECSSSNEEQLRCQTLIMRCKHDNRSQPCHFRLLFLIVWKVAGVHSMMMWQNAIGYKRWWIKNAWFITIKNTCDKKCQIILFCI
jgi:hypothetical protein